MTLREQILALLDKREVIDIEYIVDSIPDVNVSEAANEVQKMLRDGSLARGTV